VRIKKKNWKMFKMDIIFDSFWAHKKNIYIYDFLLLINDSNNSKNKYVFKHIASVHSVTLSSCIKICLGKRTFFADVRLPTSWTREGEMNRGRLVGGGQRVTNEAVCLSLLHVDNEPYRIFPWRSYRIPFGGKLAPSSHGFLIVDTVVHLLLTDDGNCVL